MGDCVMFRTGIVLFEFCFNNSDRNKMNFDNNNNNNNNINTIKLYTIRVNASDAFTMGGNYT